MERVTCDTCYQELEAADELKSLFATVQELLNLGQIPDDLGMLEEWGKKHGYTFAFPRVEPGECA